MPALPRSNLHLDILMGRDEIVDLTDVFTGGMTLDLSKLICLSIFAPDAEAAPPMDIHAQMEKKLRM